MCTRVTDRQRTQRTSSAIPPQARPAPNALATNIRRKPVGPAATLPECLTASGIPRKIPKQPTKAAGYGVADPRNISSVGSAATRRFPAASTDRAAPPTTRGARPPPAAKRPRHAADPDLAARRTTRRATVGPDRKGWFTGRRRRRRRSRQRCRRQSGGCSGGRRSGDGEGGSSGEEQSWVEIAKEQGAKGGCNEGRRR